MKTIPKNAKGCVGQPDCTNQKPLVQSSFSLTANRMSIVPRIEAGQHEFITGLIDEEALRGVNPRYALAIHVKAIDLRKCHCTCVARGQCLVCRYWTDTAYARDARRALT